MTTKFRSIGDMLKDRRGDGQKSDVYRKLNVSAGTYNSWESDMYVPGDEYAEELAEHLGIEYKDMVWYLHLARKAKGGAGPLDITWTPGIYPPGWFDRPIEVFASDGILRAA